MRYYLFEFDHFDENKLKQYKNTTKTVKKIIAGDSIIKEYKNELYRYKLVDNDKDLIVKTNGIMLGRTDFFEKKMEQIYQIPFDHYVVELGVTKYFIGPKTVFTVEKKDSKIIDFYFESKENYDNFSFKEDLNSFLSNVL